MNLSTAMKLLKSLKAFVTEKRNCFEDYESQAKEKLRVKNYQDSYKRTKQRRSTLTFVYSGGNGDCPDVQLKGSRKFRVDTYLPIIDSLVTSLVTREKQFEGIFNKFSFLETLHTLND